MSLPVLAGFTGVLVAAVATGMLAGRCVRQPRIGFIVWTAATLGLTIALAAQSMGFASGFGPATFRAVQLFALLFAPLWLAWGLAEMAVASGGARFGVRLISIALTVVAGVILATDPLTAVPFTKDWPLSGAHFQPVSRDVLDLVQAVAIVVALVAVALAVVRASRGSAPPIAAVVPVTLAVLMTAGQRLPFLVEAVYPVLSTMAAAFVWFAVASVGEPSPRAAARGESSRGRGKSVRDARDQPGDDYWPDDRAAGDYVPEGQYVTYGQGRPGAARSRGDFPGGPAHAVPDGDRGRRPGPPPRLPERPERYRGSGPGGSLQPAADEWAGTQPASAPGSETGAAESGLPADAPGSPAAAPGSLAAAAARPYGRILIFTLLDDRVTEFDRLAEEAAEQVRTGEPDTLVYVIHVVPNAPMQRIFYEIYQDRAAFDSHENQPYMQRFVTERRACVLATNVIELRLKYAKVAPLPSPPRAAAAPSAPAPPPAPVSPGLMPPGPMPPGPMPRPPQPLPAAGMRGPQGPPGPQGPSRLQGPPGPPWSRTQPPARPQRSDQPRYGERYDPPGYDQPGYDQSGYDQRDYDQRGYDQRGYDQPGYDQPGYDQPGYDQPGYDHSRAGRERYDERWPDQRQVPSGRPYGG
jgi:quinol monooxygenase YgiN